MQTSRSFGSPARAMTAAAVVLALTGSAALSVASAQEARRPAAAGRDAAGPAAGVWRMDGYGTVLKIAHGGKRVQEYQTTRVSCLRGASAERVRGHGTVAARYETADGQGFTLRRAGGDATRASMHVDGSPGDRHLRRVAGLPGRCDRGVHGSDPVAAFDVFWQTFHENYPFFAAKGVDWHAVRDRYRPRTPRPHATTRRIRSGSPNPSRCTCVRHAEGPGSPAPWRYSRAGRRSAPERPSRRR